MTIQFHPGPNFLSFGAVNVIAPCKQFSDFLDKLQLNFDITFKALNLFYKTKQKR